MPLFLLSWIGAPPSRPQLIGAIVGLALFIPIYAYGYGRQGAVLITTALAVLVIAFALTPTGGNWSIVGVYAASMISRLRPARHAVAGVIFVCAAMLAFALITRQSWFFWTYGVFIAALVGLGGVFRTHTAAQDAALRAGAGELRAVSETAERERIGRDLHDVLGRTLTVIAVKADLAERLLALDPAKAGQEIRDIAIAARGALSEVRAALQGVCGGSLVHELNTSRQALAAANVALEVAGAGDDWPAQEAAVLTMVLREAVTNIIRHAQGRHCRIAFERAEGHLRLTVRDDGKGLRGPEGQGLSGMRARLKAAGGSLTLEDAAPGTIVRAEIAETAA